LGGGLLFFRGMCASVRRANKFGRVSGQNVLVKFDSSEGKLAEGSSLLELSGLLGVLDK
jgi:hypothetical protein